MRSNLFHSLRPVRYYALLLLVLLGWYAWGGLTGTRLLGDDNESTETASNGGRGRNSAGQARFYHK